MLLHVWRYGCTPTRSGMIDACEAKREKCVLDFVKNENSLWSEILESSPDES